LLVCCEIGTAMTIGDRIAEARRRAGLSMIQLAEKMGVEREAVRKWEVGLTAPRRARLEQLATALDTSVAYLELGIDQHANAERQPARRFTRMGPVISYARASGWEAAADPFMPGDADDWLPLPRLAREGSFWLRVRGESMFDPSDRVSFPDGCYICCDPSRNDPVNKAFVIARRAGYSGDDAVTFKQYINEDGLAWLRPLNRQYEPIRDNFTIIGTVMGRYDEF